MKRWIAVIAILVGVLGWHAQAHAACSYHTFMGPDGRMLMCTTCCSGAYCTTTCF